MIALHRVNVHSNETLTVKVRRTYVIVVLRNNKDSCSSVYKSTSEWTVTYCEVHVAIGRSVNGIYVAVTVKLRRLLPVRWRGSDVADDRMRFDA